jgi:hypothetical protein
MTGRESTEIEKELLPLLHSIRSLDKLTWWHGGFHHSTGSFDLIKESIQDFDIQWQRFKGVVDNYEKEQFIKKL